MGVIRSNHCVYDTHYHLVFPVKYRKALLKQQHEVAIKEIALQIGERYEINFESIGSDGDHIHILCSFHPKYSASAIVGKVKSLLARELFKQFPELRKELWGGEFWTDGYYIATVSTRGDWNSVERYVANQGKGKTDSSHQLKMF